MGRHYDNWERLVEAVIRREQIRSLCLADSRSPSIRSLDSDFSCSSTSHTTTPSISPLHVREFKIAPSLKQWKWSGREKVAARTTTALWKGLSFLSGFSSKKNNSREESRELQLAKVERTLNGLQQMKYYPSKQNYEEVSLTKEIARVREAYTLKGHIESLAKTRGVDLHSIHNYYTV